MGNSQTISEHNEAENITIIRQLAIELILQAYGEDKFLKYAKMIDHSVFDKHKDDDIYIDHMVRIALHLSQKTYTGFYSIAFNEVARNMTTEFSQSLPIQEYFPEMHSENLTPEEKEELQQQYVCELKALSNAFQRAFKNLI